MQLKLIIQNGTNHTFKRKERETADRTRIFFSVYYYYIFNTVFVIIRPIYFLFGYHIILVSENINPLVTG